ncbi:MAG: preprotein translocase subunit SecE [Paracoccaceae bacterium]
MCISANYDIGTKTVMTNPFQFIQQVRAEVSKVVWPTRRETLLTTVMVFIMAALTATFFSLIDLIIRFCLSLIIGA